jgi:signal transduction histidine kinase
MGQIRPQGFRPEAHLTDPEVVVGVLSAEPARDALVSAIEAVGAVCEICNHATVIARGSDVDALVFDIGSAPEAYAPVAITLARDPRTRWVPRLIIVDTDTPAASIAPFGLAVVISSASSSETVAQAVASIVEQVRAQSELLRRAAAHHAELQIAESDLMALQKEGNTLSHDARVLLGVIMGYASNLRDGVAGPIVDLQRSHAGSIVEAATDASTLLDRYVTLLRRSMRASDSGDATKVTARTAVPRRRQNDLADLVRTTTGLFEGIAAARGIRIEAIAPRAVLAWCDSMQIKQVLVNLLTNAIKFTPEAGAVQVMIGVGEPTSRCGGGSARREVELVVSDSGPGIPEADRGRVFERGVRLGRDSMVPGTGLGLAVVRDIVELHGGSVRIERSALGGASFVLTLPADLRARKDDQRQRSVRK